MVVKPPFFPPAIKFTGSEIHTVMQENKWARLRDSRPSTRACVSRNLTHIFSCIFLYDGQFQSVRDSAREEQRANSISFPLSSALFPIFRRFSGRTESLIVRRRLMSRNRRRRRRHLSPFSLSRAPIRDSNRKKRKRNNSLYWTELKAENIYSA